MMKTYLALSTASAAIALSLPGAALAQEESGSASTVLVQQDASIAHTQEAALAVLGSAEAHEAASAAVVRPLEVTADELSPNYRDINPFYRDITAFYRDINPFYRDINPFYRDINPFYGNINPFYGDIVAFWGHINPFYRDIVAFDQQFLESLSDFWATTTESWIATDAAWAAAGDDQRALASIQSELNALIAASEAQFGERFEAEEGGSFAEDFAAVLLARHGIDLNDPASLANFTAAQRAEFSSTGMTA